MNAEEKRLTAKPAKILFVDDEPDARVLLEQFYDKHARLREWQLFFARNGVDALEQCASHPDIAVVITDLNMPEMDGLTLLSTILPSNTL